jgi:hypothetical protein
MEEDDQPEFDISGKFVLGEKDFISDAYDESEDVWIVRDSTLYLKKDGTLGKNQ